MYLPSARSETCKIHAYLSTSIKRLAGALLLLAIINTASAQTTIDPQSGTDPLLKPVPLPPDVASLFKFTEIPVSQSTGIADISIPIYQINMKGVSIPVRLRYHSGGIGVTETASNVGMGWALDCGGMVTQTIKGINDFDIRYGRFLKTSPMSSPSDCDVKASVEKQQDSEPDIFSFSFGGNTGSFYLDTLGNPVQINEQKLKIEMLRSGSNTVFPTNGWKITSLNGIQYYFGQATNTTSKSEDFVSASSGPDPKSAMLSNETWYLTKMVDLGNNTTYFNYDTATIIQNNHISDAEFLDFLDGSTTGGCPPFVPGLHQLFVYQITVGLKLKDIQFPNGNVQFTQGGNRCDLYGDTYLGKIAVYNNQNVKTNEYDMRYQYMIGNQWFDPSNVDCSSDNAALTSNPQIVNSYAPYNAMDTRRLFLTQVDEVDQNNLAIGSYKLNYENTFGLPGRFSGEQDWEGYYNHNGQNSLLQNYVVADDTYPAIPTYAIQGKAPSLNYAKQGILTKITYPTGGYSSFDYELNVRKASVYTPTIHPAATYTVTEGQYNVSLANFTVNNNTGRNSITFTINGCTFGAGRVTSGYSIINSQTGAVVVPQSTYSGTATNSYTLLNGSYTLMSSSSFSGCNYTVTMSSWTDYNSTATTLVNQNYGGLRIKDIQTFDPIAQSTMIKSYHYTTPDGLSSLIPSSMWPDTNYQSREIYGLSAYSTLGSVNWGCGGYYTKLSSSPRYVLPTAQNGLYTYTYVTEKDSAVIAGSGTDNGYTVYQFQGSGVGESLFSYFYVLGGFALDLRESQPAQVLTDNSWSRDKLLSKDIYKRNADNTYTNVRSEKYFYSIHNTALGNGYTTQYKDKTTDQSASSSGWVGGVQCSTVPTLWIGDVDIIEYAPYNIYSGYQTLDSTTTERYDDPVNTIKTASYFNYNTSNLLPSVIKTTNSKKELNITNIGYPMDYLISGTPTDIIAQGIQNLQNQHVIDEVIEKYTQKSNMDGSNLRTTSAMLTTYKATTILPDIVYKWEPASLTGTSFSPLSISNSVVSKDVNYQPKVSFDNFDSNGNILKQHVVNGVYESYQWGYNNQYPVAKVTNAPVNNIFYDSFEEGDGNSLPNDAKTGHYSYNGSPAYTKNITGLDYAGNYVLSYWVRPTNGTWTFVSNIVPVTGSTYTIQPISGQIDDVRFYPSNAQMTTYTYDPLIGMTSSTDAKGEITYYEYDSLQRLMNIRDKDGNITKHFDYHYQGQ